MPRLPKNIDQSLLPKYMRDCTYRAPGEPLCDKKQYKDGLCRKHYDRKNRPNLCKKPNCGRPSFAHKMCKAHDQRRLEAEKRGLDRDFVTPCAYPGCDKEPLLKHKYCYTHQQKIDAAAHEHIKQVERSEEKSDAQEYNEKVEFSLTNPGQDRIDWVHKNLKLAEINKPFYYQPYQEEFIRDAYRTEGGKRVHNTAMFSSGRKNGKTTGIAGLAVAEIHGPWAQAWKIPVASTGKEAAGVLYEQAKKMASNGGLLVEANNRKTGIRYSDTQKRLISNETGAELHCLASDEVNTLAFIPGGLILVDELGQHKKRGLYDSMDTSRGAHNPLMLIIGTRGPAESVFNSKIRTLQAHPITTSTLHLYSADEDGDPFDEEQWYMANPGLGTVLDKQVLIDGFAEAQYDEEKLQILRQLQLNIEMELGLTLEPFISLQDWKLGVGKPVAEGPCYVGVDLAETTDLCAMSFYFPETGGLITMCFVSEIPTLKDRKRIDHIDYEKIAKSEPHILRTCGKRVIDFKRLALFYKEFCQEFKCVKAGADPWRVKKFLDALDDVDFSPGTHGSPEITEINQQRYDDMGELILEFERGLRSGYVQHGANPLFQRAVVVARLIRDAANNKRFAKHKSFGRIDPLVSSTMAYGLSVREEIPTGLKKYYQRHNEDETAEVIGV